MHKKREIIQIAKERLLMYIISHSLKQLLARYSEFYDKASDLYFDINFFSVFYSFIKIERGKFEAC